MKQGETGRGEIFLAVVMVLSLQPEKKKDFENTDSVLSY